MSSSTFESEFDWDNFCQYIICKNRYILKNKWSKFVSTILDTALARQEVIYDSDCFFRARIDKKKQLVAEKYNKQGELEGYKLQPFSEKEIGMPPSEKATAGRVNPKGISCLYLSSCRETALLEARSWIAQTIMIAEFEILNKLKCINVASEQRDYDFYIETPPEVCEQRVWASINNSFSQPLALGDSELQYIPTQYLAELFKEEGYDGIIYKSSLHRSGFNIALFDQSNVRMTGSKIVEITELNVDYREVSELTG